MAFTEPRVLTLRDAKFTPEIVLVPVKTADEPDSEVKLIAEKI